jgi:hypothetical protein
MRETTSPQPKKARTSKSQMKTIITFFDIKGTVHFESIPQGQTVNQAYYMEILKQLYEVVHRKRSELRPNNLIFHNNTPAHKVHSVKQIVAQKLISEMGHPHYFPDLAPNDF